MPKGWTPREALLSAAADYLLENGLADLSLRPLASATGTSARMLVYHFGSKERLIADAMAEVRARQQKLTEKWGRRHPGSTFADLMEFVWSWVAAPEHEPYLRLFQEVLGRGIRKAPYFVEFSRATFEEWVLGIQRRLEREGRPADAARALAILTVSMVRGLALYFLATKDKRGARKALRAFVALAEGRRGG